jgi:hypothetical protein
MKRFLFLLSFLVLASTVAFAQSSAVPSDKPNVFLQNEKEPKVDKSRLRDLKGIAKDEAGQPLDGVIVQLKDLRSGKIVDFRTHEDGKYLFYDLNMDQNYELRVMKDGFESPPMKKLTKYDTRKPAILDFELPRKKAS